MPSYSDVTFALTNSNTQKEGVSIELAINFPIMGRDTFYVTTGEYGYDSNAWGKFNVRVIREELASAIENILAIKGKSVSLLQSKERAIRKIEEVVLPQNCQIFLSDNISTTRHAVQYQWVDAEGHMVTITALYAEANVDELDELAVSIADSLKVK